MYYTVAVYVERAEGVELDDLHYDDMQDDPTGEHEFAFKGLTDDDEARELALDLFHESVPIRILEHFEVTPVITDRGR
jgi:hypothetical protein